MSSKSICSGRDRRMQYDRLGTRAGMDSITVGRNRAVTADRVGLRWTHHYDDVYRYRPNPLRSTEAE
jgi:hypothetical protein